MKTNKIITVDGPSGSGKGTICRLLAKQLGFRLLDSGALYRLLALLARQCHVDLDNAEMLANLADSLDIEFKLLESQDEIVTLLAGKDVTTDIRSENCALDASRIASIGLVRQSLLKRQRDFALPPGLVADGRDMGTVVFPDALLKIFLTASVEERAQRRYKQLQNRQIDVNLNNILVEMKRRDNQDINRATAPLRIAEDAVTIDSSGKSIDHIMKQVLQAVREHIFRSEDF